MSTTSRSLVFSDGSSNKFWRIELDGASHTVTFGRVGTSGQSQTKNFDSDADAKKSYDKLVAEKTKKGYIDDGSSTTVSPSTTTTSPPAQPTPAKKAAGSAKSANKATAKPDTEDAEATTTLPATSSPIAQSSISVSVNRQILLSEPEWLLASFRNREPLERGVPKAFDLSACQKKLAKLKTTSYGWYVDWSCVNLPPSMSREESHFWLDAITRGRDDRISSMSDFAQKVASEKHDGKIDLDRAWKLIAKKNRQVSSICMIPLINLFLVHEIVERLLIELNTPASKNSEFVLAIAEGFARHVVPYLTEQERKNVTKLVLESFVLCTTAAGSGTPFPISHYMLAALGSHKEVLGIVQGWADTANSTNPYTQHYERPQFLLFGLASAELVESEWRRLKLDFNDIETVKGFLACTEYSALDLIADSVCRRTNKEDSETILKGLALVQAPEAAEPMLRCRVECRAPQLAREWLDKNVGHAVNGLIKTAAGTGKLSDAAIDYLRLARKQGHTEIIEAAIQACDDQTAAAKVRSLVLDFVERIYHPLTDADTPKWLTAALAAQTATKKKRPSWATPANLPPLILGDLRLSDAQVDATLQALAETNVSESNELLKALREHITKASRDEFAWKVFLSWQSDGYPSKEKWAMGTIGHLGDDESVLRLTPMVKIWPGESQHQRAVFGLECLRAIGSSTALMQLSGIAQKLKFQGLKAKAELFVSEIAKERGMTRDELEDRVVPDCGLDENGKREFSFGERSFSFILGGDLKAMVKDNAGKIRSDLPAASGKDDADMAANSIAEWKQIKKQIKEVATIQSRRLENAMITGRRWNQEDFQSLLVRHPLMTHLAQKLIWATYDPEGNKSSTFRITEEKDLANAKDDSFEIPKDHVVGLVHPMELTELELAQWGEVLSDYELVAPFPQLGREIYRLEAGEETQVEWSRFAGIKLPAPTLVFTLEKLGWLRGAAMDGGCFAEHSKEFPSANITAIVTYEGTVGMGYIDPNETLTLENVFFVPELHGRTDFNWMGKKKCIPLSQVSDIVLSEVIADMALLKSKAK
ncbi:MAG: DUF4132 domain-containing protein [Pirellula sp.]